MILLFLTAVVIWRVYYPALMTPDSIDQYGQALSGDINDWHPPLMSIVLRAFMKLGGGIGGLMFVQCLLALFGLRQMISLSILFFSNRLISQTLCRTAATSAVILFLIPFLTPFMFISVTFWKDAWLAIMLLWITSYLLWLFLNIELLDKSGFIKHLVLLSSASAAMILVRHNAIVILPVISVAVLVLSKIKFGSRGLIAVVMPLLLAAALKPAAASVFNISHVKTGNLVVARDLTIMLRLYPELEAEYPVTVRHENTVRESPKALNIELGNENEELNNEYVKAYTTHPIKFISAKIYLFWQMLSSKNWSKQKLAYDIIGNPYDLKINENFSGVRYKLNALSSDLGNRRYFVWVSGIHIVWLILSVLAVFYCSIKVLTKRDGKSVFLCLLYLIPLSYYFSHILAAVSPDYRYMYPATLLMQALLISLALSRILNFFQKTDNNIAA